MDYNLWQQLILGATKPFRTGANILAQNWGSALTGKDMSQSENQGGFLKWLAGGITPEEQQVINDKPYLSALKSGAGMASTLAPFGTQGLRAAQFASNPLTNRLAQLSSQGALEGSLGGFGYSREGKEVQDTLTGAGMGIGGELLADYITNPQFRKMITDASTYVDPTTGTRMYRGGLGNNDDIIINRWDDPKPIAKADGEIPISSYEDYLDPDNPVINLDGGTIDNRRVKYAGPEIVNSADIDKMVDPDNPVIDILKDDPIAQLEVDARYYSTPEEFVKAKEMIPVYRGQDHPDFTAFDGRTKDRFLPGMKGTSFATSRSAASNYGDYIVEGYVDKGSLLKRQDIDKEVLNSIDKKIKSFDLGDYGEGYEFEKVVSKIADIAKEKGKGAINLGDFFDRSLIDDEIRVISKDSFFDKNQLQDIWKRAHPNELGNSLRGGFKEILKKSGLK